MTKKTIKPQSKSPQRKPAKPRTDAERKAAPAVQASAPPTRTAALENDPQYLEPAVSAPGPLNAKLPGIDLDRLSRIESIVGSPSFPANRSQVVRAAIALLANQEPSTMKYWYNRAEMRVGRKPRDRGYSSLGVDLWHEQARIEGKHPSLVTESDRSLAERVPGIRLPRAVDVSRFVARAADMATRAGVDIDPTAFVREWFVSSHPALGGRAPLDVLKVSNSTESLIALLSMEPYEERGDDGSRWRIVTADHDGQVSYLSMKVPRHDQPALTFPAMRIKLEEVRAEQREWNRNVLPWLEPTKAAS